MYVCNAIECRADIICEVVYGLSVHAGAIV